MIKLKDLLTEGPRKTYSKKVKEGGPGSGRPRTGRAPRLDPELVAKNRASRQGQIDYWAHDARKAKRREKYASKKAKSEGTGEEEIVEGTNTQEFVTIEKAINDAFQGLRRLKFPPQSSALVRTQKEAMDMMSKSMQRVRVLKREIQ